MAEAKAPSLEAEAESQARSVIENAQSYVNTSRGNGDKVSNASAQTTAACLTTCPPGNATSDCSPGSASASKPLLLSEWWGAVAFADFYDDFYDDWWDDDQLNDEDWEGADEEWNDEDWEYNQSGAQSYGA